MERALLPLKGVTINPPTGGAVVGAGAAALEAVLSYPPTQQSAPCDPRYFCLPRGRQNYVLHNCYLLLADIIDTCCSPSTRLAAGIILSVRITICLSVTYCNATLFILFWKKDSFSSIPGDGCCEVYTRVRPSLSGWICPRRSFLPPSRGCPDCRRHLKTCVLFFCRSCAMLVFSSYVPTCTGLDSKAQFGNINAIGSF